MFSTSTGLSQVACTQIKFTTLCACSPPVFEIHLMAVQRYTLYQICVYSCDKIDLLHYLFMHMHTFNVFNSFDCLNCKNIVHALQNNDLFLSLHICIPAPPHTYTHGINGQIQSLQQKFASNCCLCSKMP